MAMLLVVSVLSLLGNCASLSCHDDDVTSSCHSSTSLRNCRCDQPCPVFADCCHDYRHPVAASSLRGNVLSHRSYL